MSICWRVFDSQTSVLIQRTGSGVLRYCRCSVQRHELHHDSAHWRWSVRDIRFHYQYVPFCRRSRSPHSHSHLTRLTVFINLMCSTRMHRSLDAHLHRPSPGATSTSGASSVIQFKSRQGVGRRPTRRIDVDAATSRTISEAESSVDLRFKIEDP